MHIFHYRTLEGLFVFNDDPVYMNSKATQPSELLSGTAAVTKLMLAMC